MLPEDVAARFWGWTLAAFLALRDAERIEARVAEVRDLDRAKFTALAMNEPKRLWQIGDTVLAELRRGSAAALTPADQAKADEIMRRVAAGGESVPIAEGEALL